MLISSLLALVLGTGCNGEGEPLITVTVAGTLEIDGDAPAAYSFQLFNLIDNLDAFDDGACQDAQIEDGDTCYGSVDVDKLDSPATVGEVVMEGNGFQLKGVTPDVGYVLIATGDDEAIACTTDVIGFDDTTKLATKNSAIAFKIDAGLTTFDLPRAVRLHCSAPPTEVEPPPPEEQVPPEAPPEDLPPEVVDEIIDDNNDIQGPPPSEPPEEWTSFTLSLKDGTSIADASAGSVAADVTCDANFPSVIEVAGALSNATSTQAFIRIQFGTGDDATFQTFETPVMDGEVHQAISLTGGYSIVQLDTNDTLDGEGETYTVTFCEPSDVPAQEMLTILTWDKDDTDVDTHVSSGGDEVAFYRTATSWGNLDIDDIDGFGPETFTSAPDASGREYEVRVHYYSDHANGPTNVTVRAVYYDSSTGTVCDITASHDMSSYEWWTVGNFGPGLDCPQ